MRDQFQKINGFRKKFEGIFARYGKKTNFKGYPETTILLQDVKCVSAPEIKCDHCWFNLTSEFAKLNLREGDIISFDARVKEYQKGYKGRRYDDDYDDELNEHPISTDYKLSYPTKVKLMLSVITQ